MNKIDIFPIRFWHIFVIAVNEKLLIIPIQFKIGQKPTLRRKPKAKKEDALKKINFVANYFRLLFFIDFKC